jgi:phage/plasmid-associated DNA primase
MIDLVTKMFPLGSVGIISSNQEQTFGLEGLYEKRLVTCPDIKEDFGKVIERTMLQSMISGESVNVARKNKVAIQVARWQVHMFMAGNFFPSYMDKSGSVARRFVVFPCITVVKKRDPTLRDSIIQHELVTILLRCIKRYHALLAEKRNAGFWSQVAPQALKDVKEELTVATNPLANFIANGDEYWNVIYTANESDVVALAEFQSSFEKHMRFAKKQRDFKMGDDFQPLKAAGFRIATVHVCKVCGRKASAINCGDHYLGGRNRRKKKSITNMKLVAKVAINQINI